MSDLRLTALRQYLAQAQGAPTVSWFGSNHLDALFAIFDDKRHPYYEHRKAA